MILAWGADLSEVQVLEVSPPTPVTSMILNSAVAGNALLISAQPILRTVLEKD